MKLTLLMPRIGCVSQGALVIVLAGGCPLAALAAEGGITHILPGSAATLIDLLPTQPGWIASGAHLNYRGDASADKVLPIAGLVVPWLEATSNVLAGGSPPTTLGSNDRAARPEKEKQQ